MLDIVPVRPFISFDQLVNLLFGEDMLTRRVQGVPVSVVPVLLKLSIDVPTTMCGGRMIMIRPVQSVSEWRSIKALALCLHLESFESSSVSLSEWIRVMGGGAQVNEYGKSYGRCQSQWSCVGLVLLSPV